MEYRSPIFPVDLANDADLAIERKVYQYDHGIKLQLTGINEQPQLHYATDTMRTSMVDVPMLEDGKFVSEVPDGILTQAEPIHVYVYIEDEEAGLTVKHLKLTVIPRAKPSSSEYTPTQKSAWDAIISQFNGVDIDEIDFEALGEAMALSRIIEESAVFTVDQSDGNLYMTHS